MKRFPKKLLNGPTAIGESQSRAMELTDLPYMTISSGEFMSRKRGMFREVTKRAAAAVPVTSFRASIWQPWGAPDMIARTLYDADKPDYIQYPTGARIYSDGSVKVRFTPGVPGVKVRRGQGTFSRQADWFTVDRKTRVSWVAQGRHIPDATWHDSNQWFDATRQGGEGAGMTGRRRGPEGNTGIGWYMVGHEVRAEWAFAQSVWVNTRKYTAPFYVVAACIVEIDQVKYVKALGSSTTAVNTAWNRRGIVGSPDRMGLMNLTTSVWTTFNLTYDDDGSALPFGGAYAFNQSGTTAVMTTGEVRPNTGGVTANGAFVPPEEARALYAFTVSVNNLGVATRARQLIAQGTTAFTSFPPPANWLQTADPKAPVGSNRVSVVSSEDYYLGGWLDWAGDVMTVAKLRYAVSFQEDQTVANWAPSNDGVLNRSIHRVSTATYELTVGGSTITAPATVTEVSVDANTNVTTTTVDGARLSFTPIDLRRGVYWVGKRTIAQSTSQSSGVLTVNTYDETASGDLYIDGSSVHTAPIKTVGNVNDIARTVPDADGAVNHFNGDVFVSVYEYGRRAGVNPDGRSSTLIYKGADAPTVLLTSADCYHGITLDMQ